MPQFDFSTYSSQIFWFLICFTIIYFFVSKIILPRIHDILETRQSVINNDLASAQRLEDQINELQEKSDELLKNANSQYQSKLDEVTKEAAKTKEKMINDLKDQIDEKVTKSRNEIKEFIANSKSKNSDTINKIADLIKAKILN